MLGFIKSKQLWSIRRWHFMDSNLRDDPYLEKGKLKFNHEFMIKIKLHITIYFLKSIFDYFLFLFRSKLFWYWSIMHKTPRLYRSDYKVSEVFIIWSPNELFFECLSTKFNFFYLKQGRLPDNQWNKYWNILEVLGIKNIIQKSFFDRIAPEIKCRGMKGKHKFA